MGAAAGSAAWRSSPAIRSTRASYALELTTMPAAIRAGQPATLFFTVRHPGTSALITQHRARAREALPPVHRQQRHGILRACASHAAARRTLVDGGDAAQAGRLSAALGFPSNRRLAAVHRADGGDGGVHRRSRIADAAPAARYRAHENRRLDYGAPGTRVLDARAGAMGT